MKKIFEKIKKVLVNIKDWILKNRLEKQNKVIEVNNIVVRDINWDLIDSLEEYDLVLVKMTNNEIVKNNIEKGHQKRPFLVKSKDNDKNVINGYYCTSNINGIFVNEKYKGLKLVLYKNNYALHKSSLLLYDKEVNLPYENVIHWVDHITSKDLGKLKKYKTLLNNKIYVSEGIETMIEIGDIVHNMGINYLIYQVDNTKCYGYYILRCDKEIDYEDNYNYILIDGKVYFIDYNRNVVFDKKDRLQVVNKFSIDDVKMVRKNKKIIKSELKNSGKKKIRKKH